MTLRFFVPGVAQPQAGMRTVLTARGNRQISTGGTSLAAWRSAVSQMAGLACNLQHWQRGQEGPVSVEMTFWLPMPKSAPAAVRKLGVAHHTARPDCDKLVRAVGDSLTAADVYRDDGQIAVLRAYKYQVADHRLVGVQVRVERLGAQEHTAMLDALTGVLLAHER